MGIEHVGPYLKQCRKARRLTQETVASALGVTVRTISSWETGRETPGAALLARFVDLVHADPVFVHALLLSEPGAPQINDGPAVFPVPDEQQAWVRRLQAIEAQLDQEDRTAIQQAIETLLRGWLPRDRGTRST